MERKERKVRDEWMKEEERESDSDREKEDVTIGTKDVNT